MSKKIIAVCAVLTLLLFGLKLTCCGANKQKIEDGKMKYTLTELEYPVDALEPWIDAETVAVHHGKHQAA